MIQLKEDFTQKIDLNGYEQWKKIQIKGLQKSTGFIKHTFYMALIKMIL